eukprot:SAG31_NODE_1096_length_9920_cov_14.794216_6_plen_64_part_00
MGKRNKPAKATRDRHGGQRKTERTCWYFSGSSGCLKVLMRALVTSPYKMTISKLPWKGAWHGE